MARRTQVFNQLPWTGGINSSVDPGVLPSNDLVKADNVKFATSGARIKRDGFSYFDTDVPQPIAAASSGTTKTLYFYETVNTASTDEILVAGEAIRVEGITSPAGCNGDVSIASIATYTPSNNTISGSVVAGAITTASAHGFYTGMSFTLTTTGTLPTGLSTGTTYYVSVVTTTAFFVCASLADALAGVEISGASGAGSGTHTINVDAVANNSITYTGSSSATASITQLTNQTSRSLTRNYNIIGVKDYWRDVANVKTQVLVAVTDEPRIFQYNSSGQRQEITMKSGSTALSSPTKVSFLVVNETLLFGFDGVANTPKKWNPDNDAQWIDLGGSAPNFEVMQQHLGRIFANDKTNKDRLHYSSPGQIEEWGGVGDSGAIDIFPGDGDPAGILAIARPFKGRLFVSKKRHIIDLRGDAPENFRPVPVTEGLGMTVHGAIVPVDLDDQMFISDKGFHSLVATDTQGDFAGSFLSQKIQSDFTSFEDSRLEDVQGAYLPSINSIGFTIPRDGETEQRDVWLFNVLNKEWYRWPDVYAQSISTRLVNARELRFIMGNNAGRIIQGQAGVATDFGTTGISYEVQTGAIYPDNNPQTVKMFKNLVLYFKPRGTFTFTVTYKIDNGADQTATITQPTDTDLLGSTFVLGESILGFAGVLAPTNVPLDGIGRGIQFKITSSGTEEPIEIYGYGIEYEGADINQEVKAES